MLQFNENTMTKALVVSPFYLDDNEGTHCGVFTSCEGVPDENIEIQVNEECWIFNDFTCNQYKGREMVFVYFPRVEYAAAVCDFYLNCNK